MGGPHLRLKFRVQHVRGTENIFADSLSSRLGSENVRGSFNVASRSVTILLLAFQEIVQMQGQDLTPKTLKEALERGEQRPKFTFKKDIFYCEVGKRGRKENSRACYPDTSNFLVLPRGATSRNI